MKTRLVLLTLLALGFVASFPVIYLATIHIVHGEFKVGSMDSLVAKSVAPAFIFAMASFIMYLMILKPMFETKLVICSYLIVLVVCLAVVFHAGLIVF